MFALYVANFANYGATYGSLGSVIVLMLWFYLTAVLLVAGAELAAALTRAVDPARIQTRKSQIRVIQNARELARKRKVAGDTVEAGRRLTPAPQPGDILPAPTPTTSIAIAPHQASREEPPPSPLVVAGLASVAVTGLALLLARIRSR